MSSLLVSFCVSSDYLPSCGQGDDGWVMRGLDGHPFPILGYANGPGFKRLRSVAKTAVFGFVAAVAVSAALHRGFHATAVCTVYTYYRF
jgi:hypothetical protein